MKRFLPGLLIGLAIGAACAWWLTHDTENEDAADDDHESESAAAGSAHTSGITVTLTPEALAAAGIETQAPQATTVRNEATGFARVLDPAPLATLARERQLNLSLARASQTEFDRMSALHANQDNVSQRAVELAQANLDRDLAVVAAIDERLHWEWGAAFVDPTALNTLLDRVQSGYSALARVDLLVGEPIEIDPTTVTLDNGQPHEARLLGPAPTVDPNLQGPAWLVEVSPVDHLASGSTLRARVPRNATAQPGWLVPTAAVVRHEGRTWIFVAVDPTTFERRAVTLGARQGDHEVVLSGLSGSEQIVTIGAQQILSAGLSSNPEEE